MGGGEKIKIPDWRIYKIDGIKELEWTRDALASRGLKSPWLRNEVWRYHDKTTRSEAFFKFVLRGFKPAAALVVFTIALDKMFGIGFRLPEKDGHH